MKDIRAQLYALDMGAFHKDGIATLTRNEFAWINASVGRRAVALNIGDSLGFGLPDHIRPQDYETIVARYKRTGGKSVL